MGLIAGAALYALGWIFLPDTAWFLALAGKRREAAERAEAARRAADAEAERHRLLQALSSQRRTRYDALDQVCRDIAQASADNQNGALALSLDTRLQRLDELLWTYLRLLTIDQSLEVYLETERRENLPQTVGSAQQEVASLKAELDALGAAAGLPANEPRRKLLLSRQDRLSALQQRLERVAQARSNLELARAEQDRLVEQAKLIRADAVAHRNAEALTTRIDLSIEHLAETNRWLSELSEFKDLTGAYQPPPPLPVAEPRTPQRTSGGAARTPETD